MRRNNEIKQLCRVITAYDSAYPEPLIFRKGEELVITDKESPWAGWIWCMNRSGESRWVPENYVNRKGKTGTMRCDYDATELTANIGEELIIEKEESCWLWCTNKKKQRGWIPAECVEDI
ncbi:SH3 domain-containing protein [bacterium]|nr:SH3 domain-containing protein [bacterium]